MTIKLSDLLLYLNEHLQPERFNDYCPNGLQVQGRDTIERIATGVTASQALIDEAIDWGADALIVHHGFFWKGEDPRVVGMKRRRLGSLLAADVSLLAYHLPLDAHPEFGNNACLGRLLGIDEHHPLDPGDAMGVGSVGMLQAPVPAARLVEKIAAVTERTPLHIGSGDEAVQRIAWCTGAAQNYIEAAVAARADVFVTGEVSEQTVHIAREEGIHFVAAGHHATERFGVAALGSKLAAECNLEHRFIDIDNPV